MARKLKPCEEEYACYACGGPAVAYTCYGNNPEWIEARCDDHSFPLLHWSDPHASCGQEYDSPAAARAAADDLR